MTDKLGLQTGCGHSSVRCAGPENPQSLSSYQITTCTAGHPRSDLTKQNNSMCVTFTQNVFPQICKQQTQNTQPTLLETPLCRPLAIFPAKCQGIKNALVYEHLEGEQRHNPKKYLVLRRGRRKKRGGEET